ncbi:MAG: hypothetical protein JWO94_1483 [Verrucomicrobiaceae bacterium]|nr:hypothetical protein [Verrucomicrobiaceae bacterium]
MSTPSTMPSQSSSLPVRISSGIVVMCLGLGVAGAQTTPRLRPPPLVPFTVEPSLTLGDDVGWTPDQTPADFLDNVGLRVKARWRQMYREPPGPPPTARPLVAYSLGGLMADSFLAMEATDSQQFRNNNQDILSYCRVLGLGDKLAPRLMSEGKLAEQDQWATLRQEVVDGHQELCRFLREQRDEDLAVLVDMGIWMRMMDMVSGVVMESPDASVWPLSIGSPALLKDLKQRFSQMTPITRSQERIVALGDVVDFLCRHWLDAPPPTVSRVAKTRDKIREQWAKLH